jgi:hypothetical protein
MACFVEQEPDLQGAASSFLQDRNEDRTFSKFLNVFVVQRSEKFRKTLELLLKNVGQTV